MPQTSTNYPGETAQTSKQIPQRTSLKPPVMLPPSTTTAASTSASNRCSTLDEKPLPAPPAQESASQEDLSSSKDLWDEAYEQLQVEQPNVVTTYESFILRQGQSKKSTRAALRELTTFDSSNRQEQLKEVIEEQQKLYGDKQWEIKVGSHKVKVKECIKNIVGAVIVAKDFISAAAHNEPHAALAWAGVSVLLPALINPVTQEDDAIAGLNYVSDTILQFRVLQQVYISNRAKGEVVDKDVQKILEAVRNNTVVLYRQILEYQFRLAAQYCRSSGIQFARDFIKLDDWKGFKDGIEATRGITLDRESFSTFKTTFMTSMNQQRQDLEVILRRLNEDISVRGPENFIAEWLQTMYSPEIDSAHDELRKKRRLGKNIANNFVADVETWLRDDSKMNYWTRGIPGVGKPMSMHATIEYVADNLHKLGLSGFAYVYFQWDRRSMQEISHIFASLLYKLRLKSARLKDSIRKLYNDEHEKDIKPSADDLGKALESIAPDPKLMQASTKSCECYLIMFDAMDEAQFDTRTTLSAWLERLDPVTFRILITSRDDLVISTEERLTFTGRVKADPHEMGLYIAAELVYLNKKLLKRGREINTLVPAIRDHAQGIFLRAALHARFVASQDTEAARKEAVQQDPGTLDDQYNKTLDQIHSEKYHAKSAIRALAWLTFAKRPLTTTELGEALAIGPDSTYLDIQRVPDADDIVCFCRGLVSFDYGNKIVRLAHQTIQEYLRVLPEIQEYIVTITTSCFQSLTLRYKSTGIQSRLFKDAKLTKPSSTTPDSDISATEMYYISDPDERSKEDFLGELLRSEKRANTEVDTNNDKKEESPFRLAESDDEPEDNHDTSIGQTENNSDWERGRGA